MRTLAAALLSVCALPLWAEGPITATVYFENGTDTQELAHQLETLRTAAPDTQVRYAPITSRCSNMGQAADAANAIVAGVSEMPSLVFADERGPFVALPLRTLTAEQITAAPQLASAPDRHAKESERRYRAKEYLLFARMALVRPMDDKILELCLTSCRALMNHPDATTDDRQLLGLRCLYPLLLMQYTRAYRGTHTPESEAKLMEAIEALEAARDLDPQSKLGKQAHDERERLRAARLKARSAE